MGRISGGCEHGIPSVVTCVRLPCNKKNKNLRSGAVDICTPHPNNNSFLAPHICSKIILFSTNYCIGVCESKENKIKNNLI